MRNNLEIIISKLFYYPIILFFYVYRFLKDHFFKYSLKSKKIKYNYFSFFSWFILTSILEIKKIIKNTYFNFCISKYVVFNKIHYSKEGRGYLDYQNLSYDKKEKIYSSNISRFEIIAQNNSFFNSFFSDNDTFLDLGCGKGENIKYLLKKFPNSKITGLDISNEALEIIREFEKSQNLFLNQIDLCNLKNIQNIKSKSFDNIIISYVLSTLLKNNITETITFRSNLISECLRISKKNIVILDHEKMFFGDNKYFEIEQINRGLYYNNIFNLNSVYNCKKEKFLIKHNWINALVININIK
jgi:ubiquinone/menaquinone biosynthesis C-methylase UbiE